MKKKIKVIHIITKLELGGAQVNTAYTYQHLDENRFEAYLLSGPGGILTDRITKTGRFAILESLGRPIHPFKDAKAFFQLVKHLKKIKPDIVHTHSSKAGIIGRLAAAAARVPVVIHSVHGFSFSPFQSFLKRTFFIAAEKFISRFTDHFIFVSRDDIREGRKQELITKKENFSLIRSGFPLQKFTQKASETTARAVRERLNIKESDFVCGIIAPFKPQKGLFHLIGIAALVLGSGKKEKNVVFVLAGDGDLRPAIETKLKEKGLSENFRLPGFMFDMENVIDIFDIGVSTALWEGLPQSLVQLRLKKKPVVAGDIPGNREVIQDNRNGFLVNVFDYPTFADRILHLVHNGETRKRMADCEEDFSAWDADYMVRQQEDLYRSLLSSPSTA